MSEQVFEIDYDQVEDQTLQLKIFGSWIAGLENDRRLRQMLPWLQEQDDGYL